MIPFFPNYRTNCKINSKYLNENDRPSSDNGAFANYEM